MRLPKPTPALVISLVALFFALGGTAFAVSSSSAPQVRCAPGAVRGIAVVSGDINGLSNVSPTYTSSASQFSYRWSCSGGAVRIRKPADFPGIEVQFVGNPATNALVSPTSKGEANALSVTRAPDGGFLVAMAGAPSANPGSFQPLNNVPFTIVLF